MFQLRYHPSLVALGVFLVAAPLLTSTPHAAEPLPPIASPSAGPFASATLSELLVQSDMRPSARVLEALEGPDRARNDDALPTLRPLAGDLDGLAIHDEIIVLEGDSQTVYDFGGGDYGLRLDDQVQNLPRITERVMDAYGDEYDFIAIWTSFQDYGAQGLAYYIGVRNDVRGIGQGPYDNGFYWGSGGNGRLQGVLNMKSIDTYGDITDPGNFIYPVMGQELTHRWLAFMSFQREDGSKSDAMLGRDDAHWSSLLEADASIQDGNRWVDDGNGRFTLAENMARFSPLDLYGMGVLGADDVPDWFLIENARHQGTDYDGLTQFPVGITLRGDRTDISIDDVIAAEGPRQPGVASSQKEFRIAYVLVTAPGETSEDVQEVLADIQTFRGQFDDIFSDWTGGRGTLCTRTTGACDRPQLRLTDVTLTEVDGDGDGMAEPGEVVTATVTIENTGGSAATSPRAHLVIGDVVDITVVEPLVYFDDLDVGASVTIADAWQFTLGEDAPCATDARFLVELVTGDLLTVGEVVLPVGYLDLFTDSFEANAGWLVNAEGADDAESGGWERTAPDSVDARGTGLNFQTQPGNGANGTSQAFITGGAAGENLGSNDIDDGVTTLTSPAIDLSAAKDPTLTFYTWRTGLDFNTGGNYVRGDDNDPLVTEVSGDDGLSWVVVDEDRSNEERWQLKSVRLLDVFESLPTTLKIRFVAQDAEPQSLSEAGVDEVRIFDLQPSCFGLEPPPTVEPDGPDDTPDDGEDSNVGDNPRDNPPVEGDGSVQALTGGQDSGCNSGRSGAPVAPWVWAIGALLLWGHRGRRRAADQND